MKIVIYTMKLCISCIQLKYLLKNEKLEYGEIQLDLNNKSFFNKIQNKYATDSYPIIEIYKNNDLVKSYISNSELGDSDKIYIFTQLEEVINNLKTISNEI